MRKHIAAAHAEKKISMLPLKWADDQKIGVVRGAFIEAVAVRGDKLMVLFQIPPVNENYLGMCWRRFYLRGDGDDMPSHDLIPIHHRTGPYSFAGFKTIGAVSPPVEAPWTVALVMTDDIEYDFATEAP